MIAVPNAASENAVTHALKDAGLAALTAFGLLLPLIGFRTVQDIRNELVLETRWRLLVALVVMVAAGRLFQNLVVMPWLARRRARGAVRLRDAGRRAFLARAIAPWAIGFVIAYPVMAV